MRPSIGVKGGVKAQWIGLALATFLVSLPSSVGAAGLPLDDGWFDFRFQGKKVGFLRAQDEETSVGGRPAIHSRRWSVLTVLRQSETIRMESTTDVWFTKEGEPIRFKHERREAAETRTAEGYRDGASFVLRMDTGGNLTERRFPLTPDTYLATSLDVLFHMRLGGRQPLKGKAISEEEGQLRDFSISVTGSETKDGKELLIVESDMGGLKSRERVTPDGKTQRLEVLGLGAEFTRTTKELALRLEEPVDLFSAALFSVPTPLPRGSSLDGLVVRLAGKSGTRPPFIEDQRQKARVKKADHVELSVVVTDAPRSRVSLPIREQAAFLVETPYEAIRDERLVAASRKATEGSADAWEAARRINAFVYGHIKKKTLARAFATASEAYETREGDCTEHAILFSALAKIAGIPTRLVTGLVYVGGEKNVFGYHEWVEVWMGKHGWIAMDPTFGQDLADPTHLKFAHGLSDPDGLRDAGLVAAMLIGDLSLQVLEYTTAEGERRKP